MAEKKKSKIKGKKRAQALAARRKLETAHKKLEMAHKTLEMALSNVKKQITALESEWYFGI
jgi:hypothetical protein